MNVNQLAAQLTIDESEKSKPYDDATGKELKPGDTLIGNITIGIGRNLSGVGISKEERHMMLLADIDAACDLLDRNLPWWKQMTDRRMQALANMCFNMGIVKLLQFKNSLELLRTGKYAAAADAFMDSKWARQVGDRAKRVTDMIREG